MASTPKSRGTLLALVPSRARDLLEEVATSVGLELRWTETLSQLLAEISNQAWSATLVSLSLDTVDEEIARRLGAELNTGALLLSARGASLERALSVERAGAIALLQEPLQVAELRSQLTPILEEGDVVLLGRAGDEPGVGPLLVGSGPAMAEVFQTLARVAASPSTVLITGESGTGKEVVAQAVHWASDRSDAPFVAVNCAAIPEHLLESELFGHERGAFTGAVARRVGRFERADGGTLFLDEIGDMSLVLQAKILRVLEDRVVERVGGEVTTPLDVRVVAATNRDLQERICEGEFREDLYYRLAVVELELPPLRERGDDVRELALHFVAHFAERNGRPMEGITEEALHRLQDYSWPGNVRELRNVLDRAVLLSRGGVVRSGDLRMGVGSPRASARSRTSVLGYSPSLSLDEVEADHIRKVLIHLDGHMGRAADLLGIHRNTLTRKVREFGIEVQPLSENGP